MCCAINRTCKTRSLLRVGGWGETVQKGISNTNEQHEGWGMAQKSCKKPSEVKKAKGIGYREIKSLV